MLITANNNTGTLLNTRINIANLSLQGISDASSQVKGAAAAAPVEEATEFDVIIKDAGPKKIETIKVIRVLTSLGLVEAKQMAETAGSKVLSAVGKEAASDAKGKLEAAGAVVEISPAA